MKPTLALIGYGKMGRKIHALAIDQGFEVKNIIDPAHGLSAPDNEDAPDVHTDIDSSSMNNVNVAIEFTEPGTVVQNIQALAETGVHMVIGTTGWESERRNIRAVIESAGTGLVYANNFSVGIHVFRKLTAYAASLLNSYSQYDLAVQEIHHNRKKDSPSGTAYLLADDILRNSENKTAIVVDRPDSAPDEHQLLISSSRVGSVPGTHSVVIDGPADSLELTHRARSRDGFAEGALLAAAWIANKKGFYSIEDMFDDIESV